MEKAIKLSAEVANALKAGKPIVALESTIISHGLPRPSNLEVALECERIVRDAGAVPATIALLDGKILVGLERAELEAIANRDDISKASIRDLAIIVAQGKSAATTVAATAHIAALAGIHIFATGGLGGVHRGANESFDESADLSTLAVTPITVVCAGVKSVLDISATLERLESLSVPVIGWQTKEFPAFWLNQSGLQIDWSLDTTDQIAQVMKSQDELGHGQGIVIANPIPEELQWDPQEHDRVLQIAFKAADAAGITGKAVTPFLLGFIVEESKGRSLAVNLDLARNNVRLAGEIAKSWSRIN